MPNLTQNIAAEKAKFAKKITDEVMEIKAYKFNLNATDDYYRKQLKINQAKVSKALKMHPGNLPYDEKLQMINNGLAQISEPGKQAAFMGGILYVLNQDITADLIKQQKVNKDVAQALAAKATGTPGATAKATKPKPAANPAAAATDSEEKKFGVKKAQSSSNDKIPKVIKPGTFYNLPVPNTKLSATAQTHIMDLEKKARAQQILQQIAEYEKQLAELKKQQEKIGAAKKKAETKKARQSGIDEDLLKYFSYIEENCGEYLTAVKASGGKILFRGQRVDDKPVFVGRPESNREPRDSEPELQKEIDGYLRKAGFTALRSNSIFTTSDYKQAKGYGDVYAIFPKNSFSFTWSTQHADIVLDEFETDNSLSDRSSELFDDFFTYVDDLADFFENPVEWALDHYSDADAWLAKLLKLKGFKKSNPEHQKVLKAKLKELVSSEEFKICRRETKVMYEIDPWEETPKKIYSMLVRYGQAFLALNNKIALVPASDFKAAQKMIKRAETSLSDIGTDNEAARVIKEFGFTKENLPAALRAGHEVCIFGEYVAVDYTKFGDEINKYFVSPNKITKAKPKAAVKLPSKKSPNK